jgi:hypothetical protein
MEFSRFELTSGLYEAHPGNSIRFEQNDDELFLHVRLKIRTVDPYPDENSTNAVLRAAALSRKQNNARQPLDEPTHNYLVGLCEVEMRKNDPTNQDPATTVYIKAVIDPKIPRTGPGLTGSEKEQEEYQDSLES